MGSRLKGGSEITVGYRYFMSLQMGLCRGPIDEIVQINVGEVRAFPLPDGSSEAVGGVMTIAEGPNGQGVVQYENGSSDTTSGDQINTIRVTQDAPINAPDLFGGDKKEGGIEGTLTTLMGRADQIIPGFMAAIMGGSILPSFRGVVTLFFDGLVCSLNPYPKPWMFRVRRTLQGWDGPVWHPELATIWLRDGMIKAMNPAHIIYECLTNRDWGRGLPSSMVDETSFYAAAGILYNEKFGLCMKWNRQDSLSAFVQQIIDHIGGSMQADLETGKLTLSLLRGNYDVNSLPVFDYNTGLLSIDDDQTASSSDLVNEVIVEWYDPVLNEDRQSRVHNLAAMQALGGKTSTTTPYDGLPTADLALRVAQRDLKANATVLKRYKVSLDRRAWKLAPGKLFRISAPDKNIFNAVLRAGKVARGTLLNGTIDVSAVLDVFGLPTASFVGTQPGEWTPPNRSAVIPSLRYVRELTYGELVSHISQADLALVDNLSGQIATMAAKPTNLSQSYSIASRAGGENFVKRSAGTFVPAALSVNSIGPYDTSISFINGQELGLINIGSLVQIGDEICRLDDISSSGPTGIATVARGCVDTIPQSHDTGTAIYFFGFDIGSDGREYAFGETVDVKLLTVTSTQELALGLAPIDSVSIVARQGRPWPPADLRINGDRFGDISSFQGALSITWVHRDRLLIQDQLVEHGAASVGPEAGTTYTVRLYNTMNGTVPVRTASGITGTSFNYTIGMIAADGITNEIAFEIEALRDGLTSKFKYRIAAPYTKTGYGAAYGKNYGN